MPSSLLGRTEPSAMNAVNPLSLSDDLMDCAVTAVFRWLYNFDCLYEPKNKDDFAISVRFSVSIFSADRPATFLPAEGSDALNLTSMNDGDVTTELLASISCPGLGIDIAPP